MLLKIRCLEGNVRVGMLLDKVQKRLKLTVKLTLKGKTCSIARGKSFHVVLSFSSWQHDQYSALEGVPTNQLHLEKGTAKELLVAASL